MRHNWDIFPTNTMAYDRVPVLSAVPIWGRVRSVPKLEQTPNRFWLVTGQSPNRFGDPCFGVGIWGSPFWFRDPQIGLGILCDSHPHFGSGILVLVWGCLDPQTDSGSPELLRGFIVMCIPILVRGSPF